jgi:hypothetical protein
MFVELRSLKPNPWRDFVVDPMDDKVVEKLRQSIEQDGFWGGVVCRRTDDGEIEIAAGHHRVKAAIAAGIQSADLYVGNGDIDDAAMVRIYAVENATQRGNSGTAQAGSVASALKIIAKSFMTGTHLSGIPERSPKSYEMLRSQLTSAAGIGETVVLEVLRKVPGMDKNMVVQGLANLKSSGHYARIIAEVQEQIERENREAAEAYERTEAAKIAAEKAAQEAREREKAAKAQRKLADEKADRERARFAEAKAQAEATLMEKRRKELEAEMAKFDSQRPTRETAAKTAAKAVEAASVAPTTFDFAGVSRHLYKASHVDAFREVVTKGLIAKTLPVESQADLAAEIVRMNNESPRKRELTATFIHDTAVSLALSANSSAVQLTRQEKEAREREDINLRVANAIREFTNAVSMLEGSGRKLLNLWEKCPKDFKFPVTDQFRRSIKRASEIIGSLDERL